MPGHVLVDAWRFAGDSEPERPGTAPYVAALPDPSARIAYVFVGVGPHPRRRIRSARRFGASPVDGTWPSDHCGVAADLTLEP